MRYQGCQEDILCSCLGALRKLVQADAKTSFFMECEKEGLSLALHPQSRAWRVVMRLAMPTADAECTFMRAELSLNDAELAFKMIRSKEPGLTLDFQDAQLQVSHAYQCRDGERAEKTCWLHYYQLTRERNIEKAELAGFELWFEKNDFFVVLASLIDGLKNKRFDLVLNKDE
jgi:hypothetical protein